MGSVDSQRRHPPVGTGSFSSCGEDRQSNERDGGSDGERADVLQQQARQAAETDHDLDGAGDDDGPLDLKDGDRDISLSSEAGLQLKARTRLSDARMPDMGRVQRDAPVSVNLLCRKNTPEITSPPPPFQQLK